MKNKDESYKHRAAINVLKKWLSRQFIVKTEMEFCKGDKIQFIPDITCFKKGRIPEGLSREIVAFYEVEHTHGIDSKKLTRMHYWLYSNQSQAGIYEVQAEWILRQTRRPDILEYIDYSIEI